MQKAWQRDNRMVCSQTLTPASAKSQISHCNKIFEELVISVTSRVSAYNVHSKQVDMSIAVGTFFNATC